MNFTKKIIFWVLAVVVAGCTLEKESAFNRSMQNLTAHYNILFNANEILAQKQEDYAVSYIDSYDRILSVYQDTTAKTASPDKALESVITKANTIISTKEQSHYIGDAYLVLGKANYLEANFFNAIEFCSYVIRSYPKQPGLVQEARVWKARSLMRIEQYRLADTVLDTAIISIFPKQANIADVYATRLQYDIYTEKYIDGEAMAKQAIQHSHDINHKLRWTFILAQLQEHNHHDADAVINYTRVVSSNASFEMAFNASLNRIRIQQNMDGQKLSRVDALMRLLRDDKNKDFIDQIYFQIGELYLSQNKIDLAIKNFKLAVRKSTKNLNQKGLAYLRLADINFKYRADYPLSKKYYDSTLTSLSPSYPGYQAILKKANNLQLLTDRLLIIAREDTLQMLARLTPDERTDKITQMVRAQIAEQKSIAANNLIAINSAASQSSAQSNTGSGNSTFYFYNTNALSQGFTDFKRVWGSRSLADNWRRSIKSPNETNSAQVQATLQTLTTNAPGGQTQRTNDDVIAEKMRQDLVQSVPLNQPQLNLSNTRILNALTDIANFYRDILDDKKEAIAAFEQILKRFPNNPNKVSVYYNLYRLYSDIDAVKSAYYKNLILKGYPGSNFAKVILDPDFNQKLNDKNAEYTAFYNQLFTLVSEKKYMEAVKKADDLISQYPVNVLTPQVYYLRTIALGHSQTLEPFRMELQDIAFRFPDDKLVTPLVKQHLTFIDANQEELKQRAVVLTDADPTLIPFQPSQPTVAANPLPTVVTPLTPPITNPVEAVKEAPSMFSMRDSTNYYFVINVNTNTVSLSPSRFGIGQFNRTNLPGSTVKHQLKPVADHQLIYVGRFGSLATVKAYARAIVPLLPQIIKVPPDKYNFFIITQENLDKLAHKKTLDSYYDFYQKKY